MEITPEIATSLCDSLSEGKSVTIACIRAGIDKKSFYQKMSRDKEFETRIARARELQQDALVDEMQDLADNADSENWQVVRLQIWQRQWTAAKMRPKKYGEKLQTEISGEDGGPLQVQWLPVQMPPQNPSK